jgi:hypothetical protein
LQHLHGSEINWSVSALANGTFERRLGDGWNGYDAIGTACTLADALGALELAALRQYPQSGFAMAEAKGFV